MSHLRSINTNQLLSNSEEAMVVNDIGRGVAVVVTPVSVVTEAVGVFHTQVQARVAADKLRETDQGRGGVVESQPLVHVFI